MGRDHDAHSAACPAPSCDRPEARPNLGGRCRTKLRYPAALPLIGASRPPIPPGADLRGRNPPGLLPGGFHGGQTAPPECLAPSPRVGRPCEILPTPWSTCPPAGRILGRARNARFVTRSDTRSPANRQKASILRAFLPCITVTLFRAAANMTGAAWSKSSVFGVGAYTNASPSHSRPAQS